MEMSEALEYPPTDNDPAITIALADGTEFVAGRRNLLLSTYYGKQA